MFKHLLAAKYSMPKLVNTFSVNRTIAAVLVLCFVMLFIKEVTYSLGGLYSQSADKFINLWTKKQSISSSNSWEQALAQALRADELAPNNPINLRRLGIVYEWSLQLPDLTLLEKVTNIDTAKTYYTEVLEHRTTSGWDWFRLFKSKILLNEVDDKAVTAINNAVYYDPSNNEMLLQLISVAMLASNNLLIDNKRQEATIKVLSNGTVSHVKQLFKLYKTYDQTQQLCKLDQQINTPAKLEQRCSKVQ